ncbi:hypothetical protein I7I50_06114 [Histoplasma capsulatum G186AR]|uniref:Uncharacterized protein n=1 Tax=Ajellomyces capsulatus TaxID=5037 RepID=A0A8H7YXE8_AJECA|nr:hypothetical protein I7I52_10808 [Histoplasma capsulatum]QSS67120.1 hypothetical protein I7I50_06114 [Histoplasma capsulatum G186AR]
MRNLPVSFSSSYLPAFFCESYVIPLSRVGNKSPAAVRPPRASATDQIRLPFGFCQAILFVAILILITSFVHIAPLILQQWEWRVVLRQSSN